MIILAKILSFLFFFNFKIMVIEILLNTDIQLLFFVQMILHFQKEINIIMYIIEFFKK